MANSLWAKRSKERADGRISPLPSFSGAQHGKSFLAVGSKSPWLIPIYLKLPFIRDRNLRVFVPVHPRFFNHLSSRYGRQKGLTIVTLTYLITCWILFVIVRRLGSRGNWHPPFTGDPPTLVYGREDLKKIWEWEIASGHYPSIRPIPLQVGLIDPPLNPGIPRGHVTNLETLPDRFRSPSLRTGGLESTIGYGAQRVYLDIQSPPPNVAYPPRPVAGSIADMDIVMDNCDFSRGKYVRDCLEVLRIGGGLDNSKRFRRGNLDRWKYIYREEELAVEPSRPPSPVGVSANRKANKDSGLVFRDKHDLEPELDLPETLGHRSSAGDPCDVDRPRLFHIFWAGPFTDKPYLAILSFLFTQNVGLHLPTDAPSDPNLCRPKFQVWINPGPAAAVPNPHAVRDMYNTLASNPWSSPFLHPRFNGVIEFKLWNTTEQLDGVAEIRDKWRDEKALFNSGGYKYSVKEVKQDGTSMDSPELRETEPEDVDETKAADPSPTGVQKAGKTNIYNMIGSTSASDYDRLSVILSDMARFILCHRYGGTYLDADTLLLRDWEELWGWKGAFAYRWSRLEKYNTAVLRMNKGSALGKFLFHTALRNELDFHPMTVARYMKDAFLEGLLLRLPDALFDSAWLNTEDYQRDRPAFPFFTEFGDLFSTPRATGAAPQMLGIDGFFKGAYSYHFHNFWWRPFDSSRNWPDLGPRFIKGEQIAKVALNTTSSDEDVLDDERDLSWSAVLKRTFESYIRGERPNMYGEWLVW